MMLYEAKSDLQIMRRITKNELFNGYHSKDCKKAWTYLATKDRDKN